MRKVHAWYYIDVPFYAQRTYEQVPVKVYYLAVWYMHRTTFCLTKKTIKYNATSQSEVMISSMQRMY